MYEANRNSGNAYYRAMLFAFLFVNCTARQFSPLGQKFMECYIIKQAQSLLMKHLVIG